ncbi:hypothetical protein [Acetobacter oryzoeni]|uniref:hypothetical protein n=1 Tax=Acetobacter oryzoeni TaxID=2500548 RepID=UPI001FCBF2FD|nr:hypothetical protein [Acetobacter oryzoeni]MCP1203658.1 hypothetical protein [Acetobacter oryzoeni]
MVYEGPKFGGTDVGLIWGGNGTETPQIGDATRNGTPTEMEQKASQLWNGKADIVFGRILEAHPQRTLRPRERPMKFAKLKERLKTQGCGRSSNKDGPFIIASLLVRMFLRKNWNSSRLTREKKNNIQTEQDFSFFSRNPIWSHDDTMKSF